MIARPDRTRLGQRRHEFFLEHVNERATRNVEVAAASEEGGGDWAKKLTGRLTLLLKGWAEAIEGIQLGAGKAMNLEVNPIENEGQKSKSAAYS